MQQTIYDAIIVGAGPAGASCGVWLSQLGFEPLILDASNQIGGLTALNPFEDAWNVTAPGMTGEEVAARIKCSLEAARVPVLLKTRVSKIELIEDPEKIRLLIQAMLYGDEVSELPSRLFRVWFAEGTRSLISRFVVIATGVIPRSTPEIQANPNPNILVGPGKHITTYQFAMKRVAILGGGDNALENAIYIKKLGADYVDIYARHIRAQKQWMSSIDPTQLHVGEYEFDPVAMTVNGHLYDAIVVLYGWKAQLNGLEDLHLKLSQTGYVEVDMHTAESSVSGVYAIGEVSHRQHPCIITAMADGVTAAKAIQSCLEALRGGDSDRLFRDCWEEEMVLPKL